MKRALLLKAVLLTFLVSAQLCAKAQNLEEDTVKRDSTITPESKPRTVFIELGGPGLALTANYDQRFGDGRDKWGFRAGAGYYNTGANWVATVPLQVNYLYYTELRLCYCLTVLLLQHFLILLLQLCST